MTIQKQLSKSWFRYLRNYCHFPMYLQNISIMNWKARIPFLTSLEILLGQKANTKQVCSVNKRKDLNFAFRTRNCEIWNHLLLNKFIITMRLNIQTIDLAKWKIGNIEDLETISSTWHSAFKNNGLVYLKNHNLSELK